MEVIHKLLKGEEDNHLMPFLWIHGESHDVYRKMVEAIYNANIRAFCIEARPHKNFGKEEWWEDLEVLLTEAEKRSMKVWILDDKHFPTGYANGGVKKAPLELHRQHICHRRIKTTKVKTNYKKFIQPKERYNIMSWIMLLYGNNMRLPKKYKDDKLLSVVKKGEFTDICSLSRNTGFHRNYINMLDEKSCGIQIDCVYEPHYKHFKERFGNTIAGFFSDEPELGNGNYLKHYNVLGTPQSLPYSKDLERELFKRLGANWKELLPLLWENDYDKTETACVRYIYMDCVTRLVEKNFSKQIGQWCDRHNVEYIGHVIEDNNQHARTSTSLGHYFRGLKWQTMAGIDDIGGQVEPGGEDKQDKNILGYINDGEFYHYALGKLGSSLGALNPRMKGRTMCEIFGNYGWKEGVRLEKYLVDHFMVRGVNYFVPHAFNAKEYPDRDCPPHFFAHGHNPQYRHFGELMKYTNRICNLISDGSVNTPAAILYHGEAEWSGECMLMQKPARVLWDNQIDFNFVPGDVFGERDFYGTEIGPELTVNGRKHKLLIIPYSQFITLEVAWGIVELIEKGCKVIFIDGLPQGICTGEKLPENIKKCDVVKLKDLKKYVDAMGLARIKLAPASNRLRCMHYEGGHELFYLFNEGNSRYEGVITLPVIGALYGYDAWNNQTFQLDYQQSGESSGVQILLEPCKSLLIICGNEDGTDNLESYLKGKKIKLNTFVQSVCKSIDYPDFSGHKTIYKLESYADTDKRFSGFIRYETKFSLEKCEQAVLKITDAYEGVEVFVNGKSAGIQVVPAFMFDISSFCVQGENQLCIEVATTLERERGNVKTANPTGITGEIHLYVG